MILKEHDPKHAEEDGNEISHDSPEWYQLHHATEQIRVPEILFQPSIIGHEQAGVSEVLEFILKKFPESVQQDLVNNVFVTGALASLPGLRERLETDLKAARPFKSEFSVTIAENPGHDAWNGAKKFALIHGRNEAYFLTKEEYLERGSEYLKEHPFSNKFTPSPLPVSEQAIK